MNFVKMQGTGNDFVVLEDGDNKFLNRESDIAKIICDRHFGIGADGILLIRNSDVADVEMVIINSDGSYAAMCGNGIRCFAKYVYDEGVMKKQKISIKTGDGIKIAEIIDENGKAKGIKINMGSPSFISKDIPANVDKEIINYDVNINNKTYKLNSMLMGVPHTVILGKLNDFDVKEGSFIEKYKELFPEGTNVNFCEVEDRENIKVKTWERGAGATLACGTGCCASAVACNKLGFTDKKVKVSVPGGNLEVEICDEAVYMIGGAEITFRGETDLI
ncbi:diaminopimelate epimerase [Clostridium pasteurianum DSM 525 = ATCC 6013]|uniref:Diaminopimelate epimerase n=1 Tax=Clostridium pasteurianum DSM 525 = ATCC 6013 TaxID=1262449 RepID=A0A0H3J7Q2_CLOPA|nr:diaminopimelate epimerase [Clostridium pasteurianum]AJA47943.1 diaminopimelate epimerase [Clostridium pasteurianum DSM 525 = ATCC 6013]AJA51931.1 diaminopimelate epimerase [Clostridium pasteurianum DSM 525 = ATCC 6013]AOZ75230.1 diaminopimelate epimerase [Clostridium pasteurianum DSM 525 = ATCC 6013]AOZ79025.1 diaminopimelate epimerase [Clostridium pasteurianum]ELP59846.1 diaminopimelate epimerase [Clostridium pasteurianum DSM 525 = ATCC 6013]